MVELLNLVVMMKKVLVSGLMVAVAVCSCQKVEKSDATSEGKVFTATIEKLTDDGGAGIETKTFLDVFGTVIWEQGDRVSLFAGSTINEQYRVSDMSEGQQAAILERMESPGFVAGGELPVNVAFYPYSSTAAIARRGDSYVLSDIILPATQSYAYANIGDEAFPMAAVSRSVSDMNLMFKNVLGGLKLQLTGTATILSISIEGNNGEKLCGEATITVSNTAAPAITLADATPTVPTSPVTLGCGYGVQLEEELATVFIIALPPVKMTKGFTVTITDTQGRRTELKTTRSQTITRSNLLKMPVVNIDEPHPYLSHEYVNLGLPSGLKWATCNLGANAPEESGDYFAWGETEPYYSSLDPLTWKSDKTAGYNWASYQWCNGTGGTMTKYCTSSSYGNIDNNAILDPEDDAASVNWGGNWRIPTEEEWTELRTECTWEWTTRDGVNGRLVTGPNGNSIFLPAAGGRTVTQLVYVGIDGRYWSSSLSTGYPYNARTVHFNSDDFYSYSSYRCYGLSVRPVFLQQ